MNQKQRILDLLSGGEAYTMDQIVDAVGGKRSSMLVHISNLRKEGYKITSSRDDGVVTYHLTGSKGRKRAARS